MLGQSCPLNYQFMRDGLCHGPGGATVTPIYPEADPRFLVGGQVGAGVGGVRGMSNAELQRIVQYAEACVRMRDQWRERSIAPGAIIGSRGPVPRCPGTAQQRALAPYAARELERRAQEGTPITAAVAGLPAWWPYAAIAGGGALLWWFTKKGK